MCFYSVYKDRYKTCLFVLFIVYSVLNLNIRMWPLGFYQQREWSGFSAEPLLNTFSFMLQLVNGNIPNVSQFISCCTV